MQGYLEIWGSMIWATFTLNYECGSVAGLQRNVLILMRGEFYAGHLIRVLPTERLSSRRSRHSWRSLSWCNVADLLHLFLGG